MTLSAIDWAVALALSLGAIYGLRHGAMKMVTWSLSTIAGLYLASLYYGIAAAQVQAHTTASPSESSIVGYIVVFAIVFAAVEFIGASAFRLMRVIHLGWADRFLGAALGGGLVAVGCGFLMMLLAALVPPDSPMMRNSKLAPMLLAYNETIVRFVPVEVKVAYERNRDDLMRYWIDTALKTHEAAGSPAASPSPR